MLLLHGFLGAAADWDVVAACLEGGGVSALSRDLPGHGATPLDACELCIDAWADWLERTTPSEVRHAVGYSMGGRVLLAWAARHPRRFEQLVLVSSSAGIADPALRKARRLLDRERAVALRRDLRAWLDDWYQQPLFASLDNDHAARAVEVERRASNDPEAMARVIEAMSPGRVPPRHAWLASAGLPTTWCVGRLDERYVERTRELVAQTPHATLVMIEHAGHALVRSHGRELADELLRLVAVE